MKKMLAVSLALLLLFTGLGHSLINPLSAGAAEPGQARVVGSVGDGLRYYVVFEYNGQQYRSDQMGPAFNANMWKMLSDADRKTVTSNYGWALNQRRDHFGVAGSQAIADWHNDITGWKAAGEQWQNAIGAKEYSELTAYYTGTAGALPVGDQRLDDVKSELRQFAVEVKQSDHYETARQLVDEIEQEYAAGQTIYNQLKSIKAKQIGNAFKAGSKVLIQDIIVDNIMLPAITPTAAKASEAIAQCLGFLKDRLMDAYDKLVLEPEPGEILAMMQEMLDILERTDNSVKNDINDKLAQLPALMAILRDLQQQEDQQRIQKNRQKQEELDNGAVATFSWSSDAENYNIPGFSSEMTEAERAQREAQVRSEAAAIKSEFEAVLDDLVQRKSGVYNLLDYDDRGELTNHPTFQEKHIDSGLTVPFHVDVPNAYSIDLTYQIDPFSHFHSEFYSDIKQTIANDGADVVNNFTQSIKRYQEYIDAAEALLTDGTLNERLDSVEKKINGLETPYADYVVGGRLASYVLGDYDYQTIRGNLEAMLNSGYNNDYAMLAYMEEQKALVQKNIDDFKAAAPLFEAQMQQAAADYDSLYTNMQNSASFAMGAYNSLKNMYQNSPYFTTKQNFGQTLNVVDSAYIDGLIGGAAGAAKETMIRQIVADLLDLRAEEQQYLHRIDTGINNCQYDVGQLNYLLTSLGVYGGYGACQNLGKLIGKDIEASAWNLSSLLPWPTAPGGSDIPQFIEMLQGTSDAYYNAMILSDKIERQRDNLRAMNNEDFEAAYTEYKDELAGCMMMDYGLSMLQVNNAWAEHNRGVMVLDTVKLEREQGLGSILVDSITPIFAADKAVATNVGISVGETCQLDVIISPVNATNQQVYWFSDNPGVVAVDNRGLIKGLADGTANITITSADGNAGATCYVLVSTDTGGNGEEPGEGEIGVIARLEITGPTQISIPNLNEANKAASYQAKAMDQYGHELPGESVTWSLEEAVLGVSLTDHVVTVTEDAEPGTTFTIIATSNTDQSVMAELTVLLTDTDECFIATAAFGSKLSPAVALLRQFRDAKLLTNAPGRAFVNYYYTHSPAIAQVIGGHEGLKLMVKVLLLPVVALAWALMHGEITITLLIMLMAYWAIGYKRRQRVAR